MAESDSILVEIVAADERGPKSLPKRMALKHGRYYHLKPKAEGGYRWIALSRHFDEALVAHNEMMGAKGRSLPPPDSSPAGWIGGELSAILARCKSSAAKRDILFALTKDHLVQIGERSNWRCAVTGLKFSQRVVGEATMRPYMPSVDRIDSCGGYTLNNCRLVCACVNLALNEWGEGVLAVVAKAYLSANRH